MSDNTKIDLTKDEALSLLDAQHALVMATQVRNGIANALSAKYGLKATEYSLDPRNGCFVKLDKPEVAP